MQIKKYQYKVNEVVNGTTNAMDIATATITAVEAWLKIMPTKGVPVDFLTLIIEVKEVK